MGFHIGYGILTGTAHAHGSPHAADIPELIFPFLSEELFSVSGLTVFSIRVPLKHGKIKIQEGSQQDFRKEVLF